MIEPIEREILARAAVLNPKSGDIDGMRACVSSGVNMSRLIDTAIGEGLGGLLYKSLRGAKALEGLGVREKETLETHYYQVVRNNLRLIHDLREILPESHKRSIRPVLLQGADLIHEVYEDAGLRPMVDIDLWVLKKDHAGFVGILRGLGYENVPFYANTFRRGSTTVDVHPNLLWADRIRRRALLLRRTEEEIHRNTRTVTWEGEEAQCLNRYDRVIYLALHGLKHRFNRLIWLVDIMTITARWESSDWVALQSRAKVLGQARAPGYIVFLLSRLFGHRVPEEVRRALPGRLNLLERRALMGRVKGRALPVWGPPLLFSSEMGTTSRLSFILESLFPRPDILQQVFPSSQAKPWQLYLKRVGQVVGLVRSRS